MNTDLKHYLYFAVCTVGRVVCSTVAMAILARFLDPSGLGRWTLLVAAATFFHSICANWLQQDPFLRFGKEDWTRTGNLRRTWGVRLPLLTVGILLSLIGFTLLWPWFKTFFQLSQPDGLLAFAYFMSLVISLEVQTVLQITGRMDRMALAPALIAAASVPLYFVLWRSQLPSHRVEISLFETLLLITLIWLAVGTPEVLKTRPSFSGWDRSLAHAMLVYAAPILPTTALGYLMNWGNQVLIHRSFSNHEVGLYQSAFQVHGLMVSLAVPFTTILVPRLVDRHLEDPTAMHRFVRSVTPTLFCLWLLAVIPAVVILPALFVRVYGASFSEGVAPLTALLVSTPLCALGQIYTGLFTVQGRLGKMFWIIFAMVAVNLLGAWVLVPHDRITVQTVALAFSAGFSLAQFLMFYYQHRVLREPATKGLALMAALLIFSIGQIFIPGLLARLGWGIFGIVLLIGTARWSAAVDRDVLNRLFAGRLEPLGQTLDRLLTSS